MARKAQADKLRITPVKGGYSTRVQIGYERKTIFARTVGELRKEVGRRIEEETDRRAGVPVRSEREQQSAPRTYDEACERFLSKYPRRQSSKDALTSDLAASRRHFGSKLLHQIVRYDGEIFDSGLADGSLADRGRPIAPVTRRHYLSAMERVLTYSVRHIWLDRNPLEGLIQERGLDASVVSAEDREKADPFDSWEEVFRIAEAIGWRRWGQMVRFAAGLGLSPQEAITPRACDVVYVPRSKRNALNMGAYRVDRTWDDSQRIEHRLAKTAGRRATLPLTPIAAEVLDELYAEGVRFGGDPDDWANSTLLFPDPLGRLTNLDEFRRGAWKLALAQAGVRYRPPKHLRHTFATLSLVHGGLDKLPLVSLAMRHDKVSTTESFYIARVKELRRQAASHVAASMPLYGKRVKRRRP